MTVIVFLIDTSASMMQKTYLGTTYLDFARLSVELFLKQRQRDPSSKQDRYMLMTFEDYPFNVKSGWKESQAIFTEQLKNLRANGVSNFKTAVESALRFVNLNRMQTGIENYGYGRYPLYSEHVVIISPTLTNDNLLGNDLTTQPFRWDQRLFSLVLRFPGHHSNNNLLQQSQLTAAFDDSLIQNILEKTGPDPKPLVENGKGMHNGAPIEVSSLITDSWKSQLVMLLRPNGRPGHWPIPEAYCIDTTITSLPPRLAHPVVCFRCDSIEPSVLAEFPFDKYELENSPLTQFIIERKEANICWQVDDL